MSRGNCDTISPCYELYFNLPIGSDYLPFNIESGTISPETSLPESCHPVTIIDDDVVEEATEMLTLQLTSTDPAVQILSDQFLLFVHDDDSEF